TRPATSTSSTGSVQACSAAFGRLVRSRAPFLISNRLIQPFGYVNVGQPCELNGFPVVRLLDSGNKILDVKEANRDVVLGTAKLTPILLGHNDDSSGFNIETATT